MNQQWVTWPHGFTFHACPPKSCRLADSGHPRRARATHGSRPRPAKTSHRNYGSGHHSSTAWLHMRTLWSTQSWSKTNSSIPQNAVNKRISKGWKTNPNSHVLFEVRISKLRLTSLLMRTQATWRNSRKTQSNNKQHLPSLKKPGSEVTTNEAFTAVRLRVMRPGSPASSSASDAFSAVFNDTVGSTESVNCLGTNDPVFERVTKRWPSDTPANTNC